MVRSSRMADPGSVFAYNLSSVEYANFVLSVERDVLLQMTPFLALLCYSALLLLYCSFLLGTVVWPSVANLGFWRFAQSDIVIVLCTISIIQCCSVLYQNSNRDINSNCDISNDYCFEVLDHAVGLYCWSTLPCRRVSTLL